MDIKVYVPCYYKNFKCIADKCPDTCCAGWEANFGEEEADFYRCVGGDIGDKLRKHLASDENGDNFFTLTKEDRCPFLNAENLCELYISLGEESLCPTCKLFPRFYDDFGSFRETGLGFGCPEAARLILCGDRSCEIVEIGEINEAESCESEIDPKRLELILGIRERLFGIFNGSADIKLEIKAAFDAVKMYESEECTDTPNADFSDCVRLMEQMEYIDSSRRELFCTLSDDGFDKRIFGTYQADFEKLMCYYIYRYFFKSVYDGEMLTKLKYGVFACAVIGRIYSKLGEPSFERRCEIMCGYSKEVEYSDVNIEILDDAMYYDFDTDSLLKLF